MEEPIFPDLRRFLVEGLPLLGALVEEPRNNLVELLLPDELASSLGVPTLLRLALSQEMAKEVPDAEYLTYGSNLLDLLIALARTQDTVGCWYVTGVIHPAKNLREELARRVKFPNAWLSPAAQDEEIQYHYAAVFWFRVTYLSHEKREALHTVAVDLHTHMRVDPTPLLLCDLDQRGDPTMPVAPFWQPAGAERPPDLLMALHMAQERAARILEQDLQDTITVACQRAARRLEDAQARLNLFYDDLLQSLERRRQRADEAEKAAALMAKIEAVQAERAKKLAEAQEQHRLRVTLHLVAAALIARPMITARMSVENRYAKAPLVVAWDPVAKDLSIPACQVCGRPSNSLHLCVSGHLICSDDALRCAACSWELCRTCATVTCVVCRKPLCRRHQQTCTTCGQVTCPEHAGQCHRPVAQAAEPAPKPSEAMPKPNAVTPETVSATAELARPAAKSKRLKRPEAAAAPKAKAKPSTEPPLGRPENFIDTLGHVVPFPVLVSDTLHGFLASRPKIEETLDQFQTPIAQKIRSATSWETLRPLAMPILTLPLMTAYKYIELFGRQLDALAPEVIPLILQEMDQAQDDRALIFFCCSIATMGNKALGALLAALPRSSILTHALMEIVLGVWPIARGVPAVGEEMWQFYEMVKHYRKGIPGEIHLCALLGMANWEHPRLEEALIHVLEGKPSRELLYALRIMALMGKETVALALARFLLRSPGDWETPAKFALAYILTVRLIPWNALPPGKDWQAFLGDMVYKAHLYWRYE